MNKPTFGSKKVYPERFQSIQVYFSIKI